VRGLLSLPLIRPFSSPPSADRQWGEGKEKEIPLPSGETCPPQAEGQGEGAG